MSLYKQAESQFWWFQVYGPNGKRVRKSTGTADRKKAKVAGEGHTFHSWRHTFRTRLSEAGVSDGSG